ncbi:MAG: hypothetical protein ACT4QE_04900 [Anaerolineales bacterium]
MYKRITTSLTALLVVALLTCVGYVRPAFAQGPTGTYISGIACVNLGTSAATVTLTFYQQNSSTIAATYADPTPIDAGTSRNYITTASALGLPSNFLGSAVVSSNQPVSCNVNTQSTGDGLSSPYRIDTSGGVPSADAGTTIYVPQAMKNAGGTFSSYISIQNTGSSSANVQITYKNSSGADIPAATENLTIPAQSNLVSYQTNNANLPAGYLGPARITSTNGQPLATTVVLFNSGASSTTSQLLTYNGFTAGANRVFIPRVVRRFFGYNSGFSIQNVGAGATTVTITFSIAGNTFVYNSGSIAAGASLSLFAPNITELDGVDALNMSTRTGSAVIQAAGGGSIVVLVNEDNRGDPNDNNGQPVTAERAGQGASYRGIPDGAQTTKVFFAQLTNSAGGIFSGGFQVSNTTATAGTCNITYGTSGVTETGVSLPGNGSFSRFGPGVAGLPSGYNSSVTVTCTQTVVGIGNLAANSGSGRVGDSFTQSNLINQ